MDETYDVPEYDAIRVNRSWRSRFDWLVNFCKSAEWAEWYYDDSTFYNSLAERLQEYVNSDVATIQLYDVADIRLAGAAFRDPDDRRCLSKYGNLKITAGRFPELIQTHKPIIMDFENPDARDIQTDIRETIGMTRGITLPLVYQGSLYGVVNFLSKKRYEFTEGDCTCLMGMAAIVAPFIASRDTSVRYTEARLLDERRMLSTELHDNLSQLVNTVRIEAEQAVESLKNGDSDSLTHELELLEKASAKAVAVLRDEMFALRDSSENAEALVDEIREMAKRFEQMWGIWTHVHVNESVGSLVLPKHALMQVDRIIHEALSNVMRHAEAENVWIDIDLDNAVLSLRVSDDGCGFDTGDIASGSMGMRIMRERIESVNGELAVSSEPGDGTTVLAALPVGLGRRVAQ